MKIRFGVGLGPDSEPRELPGIIDGLESAGIDSLWFSELVYSPAAFRRIGALADGWLGSFLTPTEAGRARDEITAAAAAVLTEIRWRRPDLDPAELVPPTGRNCTASSTTTWPPA